LLIAFPTPTQSALEIGPLTIHFYALCIITGIAIAIWLGDKRFRAQTVNGKSVVSEVAITAVPVGIIGGRIWGSSVLICDTDHYKNGSTCLHLQSLLMRWLLEFYLRKL